MLIAQLIIQNQEPQLDARQLQLKMLQEEVVRQEIMGLEIVEARMAIVQVQVLEEPIHQVLLNVQITKAQQHDMVRRIVRHTKELKEERQLEGEQATIQNLKAIHDLHIIVQVQDDQQIRERQAQDHLDIVRLKALLIIIEAQQKVQREDLLAHTALQDLHHRAHQDPFALQVLHQDHLVEVVQLEVQLLKEDAKLLLDSGY